MVNPEVMLFDKSTHVVPLFEPWTFNTEPAVNIPVGCAASSIVERAIADGNWKVK